MTALWILGIILALIVLLLFLRVGVLITFGDELRLSVLAGPLRLQLLPQKEKKPKKPKKPREPKNEKEPPQKDAAPKPKKKLGLTLEDILSALPYLWQSLSGALKKTGQRMRIDPMTVSLVLGGAPDPAQAAQNYGRISAAVWTVMPRLEQLMRLPAPYIHLDVDYGADKTQAQGEVGISFQIRDFFAIALAFGIPVLKWLLRWRKEEKRRAAEAGPETKTEQTGTEQTNKENTTPDINEKG